MFAGADRGSSSSAVDYIAVDIGRLRTSSGDSAALAASEPAAVSPGGASSDYAAIDPHRTKRLSQKDIN